MRKSSTHRSKFRNRVLLKLLLDHVGITQEQFEQQILEQLDLDNAPHSRSKHRTQNSKKHGVPRISDRTIYRTKIGTVYVSRFGTILNIVKQPSLTVKHDENTVKPSSPSITYRRRKVIEQ